MRKRKSNHFLLSNVFSALVVYNMGVSRPLARNFDIVQNICEYLVILAHKILYEDSI